MGVDRDRLFRDEPLLQLLRYPGKLLERRFAAEASEAQGQWAAAAESWQGVLDARGQIIQDGFTPDLRLAETGRARAIARAGKD